MTRGGAFTGAADSKAGILSFWIRIDGGNGTTRNIFRSNNTSFGRAFMPSTNVVRIIFTDNLGISAVDIQSAAHTAGATWLNVLSSWDVATAGARHLYVNDTSELTVTAFSDLTIDYTDTNWGVGATVAGGSKLNACLAEFYFAPGQYLDLSVTANRRQFISATGKPVSLGSDGSTPTGTAPIAYFHLDKGETAANFALNRGTGGDFAITGALTTGSTSPSD